MPVIGFKGFTAGAPVALLVDQGAVSAGNSVTSWRGSVAEIGIEIRTAGANVAPAAVWLRATTPVGFDLSTAPAGTAYDPAFHEITYIWTVRGQPLSPFTAPTNLVTQWNNPNVMYGAEVAFALADPGTYTIDLWCVGPNGETATAETTLVVQDPDAVYSDAKTLCLALDGDFTGKPAGALEFTTVAGFISGIENLTAPGRALFKRGEDYADFDVGGWVNYQYLGAWGTGADPIVRPPRGGRLGRIRGMRQFTVTDLDFRGGWDAATETGSPTDQPFFPRDNPEACWHHYHKCSFSGFAMFEATPGLSAAAGSGVIFSDTVITNWQDYGIFTNVIAQQAFFGVVGCRFQQNVDALNGGARNSFYNNHGPMRLGNFTNVYIGQSDFFSRNGWSALVPDNADQPCLRLNSSPQAAGNRATIDRLVCEGGFYQLALETQNGAQPEFDSNYVLDKVLCVSTGKSINNFISLAIGGTTIRNAVGIMPNVPQYHTDSWVSGVRIRDGLAVTANLDSPIRIYNSTFLNLRDTANDPGDVWPAVSGDLASFTSETFENNIAYAPDIDTPEGTSGPLDTSTAIPGVTPRYKGVRFNFDHEEGTLGADVPNGGTFTLAYPAGTDQAYWQAIQATDTRHMIVQIGDPLLAENGAFTVTFGASDITITNTSGRTWAGGEDWVIRLDRKSLIPAMDTTYASPATLPLPRPLTGSPEIGTGDMGRRAHTDFLGQPRPATGDTGGALLPD